MLSSPIQDASVDALHGPVCTDIDILKSHGEMSAVLRVTFKTWVAPPVEWTIVANAPIQDETAQTHSLKRARYTDRFLRGGKKALPQNAEAAIPVVGGIAAGAAASGAQVAGEPAAGEVEKADVKKGRISYKRTVSTPALLSNRWSMAFQPDPETWLMAQVVEGEAIFRSDVLSIRGLTADQLRTQIWHPIPPGYVRTDIDVKQSSNGAGISYSFTDRQKLMNFPGGVPTGMVKIEVEQQIDFRGYDQSRGT